MIRLDIDACNPGRFFVDTYGLDVQTQGCLFLNNGNDQHTDRGDDDWCWNRAKIAAKDAVRWYADIDDDIVAQQQPNRRAAE